MKKYALWAALAFALDRLSKCWAANWLAIQPGGTVAFWPNVLHLTYARNTGMAFGMLPGQRWLLLGLTTVVLAGMLVVLLRRAVKLPRVARAALWVLWGGAFGNWVDRLLMGYVVDFIEIRLFRFAIFNLADAFVSCAAAVLVVYLLCTKEETARERVAR